MRGVDLAIYADALAGESASLAARAERAHSRLRQAAMEHEPHPLMDYVEELAAPAYAPRAVKIDLDGLALLDAIEEDAPPRYRECIAIHAGTSLQTWVEAELARNAA